MTKGLTSSLQVRTDIWELMGAGVFKYFSERFLTRYIGNKTLTSGLLKLGIPVVGEFILPANIKNNFIYKIPKTALIIDGAEDIVFDLMGKFGGNGGNNTQTQYI